MKISSEDATATMEISRTIMDIVDVTARLAVLRANETLLKNAAEALPSAGGNGQTAISGWLGKD